MTKMQRTALSVEIIGVTVTLAAIVLEIIQKAEIYLIIATGGAFLISSGGLLWAKVYKH